MLGTLKHYFFKLPVIRGWKYKRDKRNIKRGIETLNGLKYLLHYQTYTDDFLKEVYSILSLLTIRPEVITRLNKLKMGSFYSVSTQFALNFIQKKYFTKNDIQQYKGVNLALEEKPINCWISSEQAIHYFIDVILETLKAIAQSDKTSSNISSPHAEFADTMLFRLLLADFATLVALILEIDYETDEREI